MLGVFLETTTKTTEVVDGEGADKVDSGRSAESNSQTFGHVHCGFTTVSLAEGDLHTS
jgi:hypothetical protein